MNKLQYDKEALLKAIIGMEKNIEMFEAEIVKLKQTIVEYKALMVLTENNVSNPNI